MTGCYVYKVQYSTVLGFGCRRRQVLHHISAGRFKAKEREEGVLSRQRKGKPVNVATLQPLQPWCFGGPLNPDSGMYISRNISSNHLLLSLYTSFIILNIAYSILTYLEFIYEKSATLALLAWIKRTGANWNSWNTLERKGHNRALE